MKPLEAIKKFPDGSKVKFETYIWSEMFGGYEVQWKQSVRYCPPKKRKWETAIKGLHYTDTDLKVERMNFCTQLMNEVKNDGWKIKTK